MALKDVGSGLNVLDQGDLDAGREPNGLDQGDGVVGSGLNDLNQGLGDDNVSNMLCESAGDVFQGLNFSWIDRLIDEDNYETDVENNGSEWVNRERLVSDDDEDEIVSIKNNFKIVTRNISNRTVISEDLQQSVVGANNINLFKEENTYLAIEGQYSGEDVEYLYSSDVCSFEIDSDSDSVCKKFGKIFFYGSTVEPMFELGMVFESQQQLRDALCAYAVAHKFDFKLFDYVFALRSVDPNGTFDLMVERPTAVESPKFRRFYVCFSALKEGFKKFCSPVISLDGCYLKRSLKGEILAAVGRDSNDQIFPIV
ncbi:hypothetical protein V6N13_055002 [Hibiscus sabdariffa]